jgi:hypothetical protein
MTEGTNPESATPSSRVSRWALAIAMPLGMFGFVWMNLAASARIDTREEMEMLLRVSYIHTVPLSIAIGLFVFGVTRRLRPSARFSTTAAVAVGAWITCAYLLRSAFYEQVRVRGGGRGHVHAPAGTTTRLLITNGPYPATIFTSFLGTTMILRTVLPAVNCFTLSEARAAASSWA